MDAGGTVHTFLFTDLVGYTALTEADGDDRAAEVALAFHEHVRGLLAAHGAEEIKTLGDGLMLRADDPARGVRLAVRIVDGLAATPGFPAVRVGVHTGPAVTRAGDWFGGTVNVASRLCTAAGGGEVLISAATAQAAGALAGIELGAQRRHWLRNITRPVIAHPASSVTQPAAPVRLRAARAVCLRAAPALLTGGRR